MARTGEHKLSVQILIFCLIPRKNNLGEIYPTHHFSSEGGGWQTLFFLLRSKHFIQILAKHFGEINPYPLLQGGMVVLQT